MPGVQEEAGVVLVDVHAAVVGVGVGDISLAGIGECFGYGGRSLAVAE